MTMITIIMVKQQQFSPNDSFVSKPTKTSEKDHLFHNTISLKKPHSFYEPQLT